MTGRETLPPRRANVTFEFRHEWEPGKPFPYHATVGYRADGLVGELFLNGLKHGTPLDANARDAAVCVSIALQYGAPLDVLRHAMARNSEGYPSSPIGMALDEIKRQNLASYFHKRETT